MYCDEREKVDYAISQMRNPIFDVIHDSMKDIGDELTLENCFMKIRKYMRLHLQERSAKKKLLTIAMKNNETISEFYLGFSDCESKPECLT